MTDRRRRIVFDDDDDYRSGASSQKGSGKRGAPSSSSGSQKRVIRDDDSDQDLDRHVPSATKKTATTAHLALEDLERLVKDVVRLAIFTSHSDQPLKRDDIKIILNDYPRMYDQVLQKAQERLRDVFGMEMVELTTRNRSGQSSDKGNKSYILRNILPMELLASSVVDWELELEDMGLLMVILSLIMVREGAIYEKDSSPFGDIQKKLDVMIKKRYLEKYKLEHMDESGEKAEMEYRWGARARVEVPAENVVQFIQEVFGREAPLSLEASILKASGLKGNEPAQQQ
ncbi:Melanoma-associated antigen F1 [Dissophora ornata]|nr:Melanoma-associated antigen F1 [Dissophora ornata]